MYFVPYSAKNRNDSVSCLPVHSGIVETSYEVHW